jgi:raffinose/stachyose/melibiose transport system permease protein
VTALAPPAAARATAQSTRTGGRSGSVAWMALPALLFFITFAVVPLAGVLFLSFTRWDGIGAIHAAGFESWRSVLTNRATLHALWVTFLITALSWAFQTPMILAGHQRYRGALAVFLFIPLLLSSAALAITFKALLDPNFGLGTGLGVSFLSQDWLGKGPLAVGVLVFVVSWQYIPFHSLLYQAGVRQIPVSLYEAAQIDGAGRLRQFFSITLPQLKYTFITSSTLMIVGSLTFFDIIFVLTAGGPADATRTLALDMYITGFQGNQMGPASAIAMILVLVGLVVAVLLQRLGGRDRGASQLEGM